eukprot:13452912-Heterocapsa_arctica.AAC.1
MSRLTRHGNFGQSSAARNPHSACSLHLPLRRPCGQACGSARRSPRGPPKIVTGRMQQRRMRCVLPCPGRLAAA